MNSRNLLAVIGVFAVFVVFLAVSPPDVVAAPTAAEIWNLKGATIIDLSHVQDSTIPADPALKVPTLEFFSIIGQGDTLYNLEVVSYCPHTGTHLDSPFHVNKDAGKLETVDPAVLIGPASVIDIKVPPFGYAITAADIKAWEAKNGQILYGDGILIHTGHDIYWPVKSNYIDKGYPYLATDAAEYLVTKKVRYVGLESISVDTAIPKSHRILMDNGVIVVENLTNIDKIGQTRCATIGTFPNIKGATGAYVRLLAIK